MRVMILTDNKYIYEKFIEITKNTKYNNIGFDYFCTASNHIFQEELSSNQIKEINLREQGETLLGLYDVAFSLHCKQMFPNELVNSVRCINVHPGLNPYNRGWFPQVFSIINRLPAGVTIHEMDEQLDHGPMIVQKEIEIYSWETSEDVYKRILETEVSLLSLWLKDILDHNYSTSIPSNDGTINYKKDFIKLCEIDLNERGTHLEFINKLRALTFSEYNNAYFFDEYGNKVYITITLKKE